MELIEVIVSPWEENFTGMLDSTKKVKCLVLKVKPR